MLNEGRKSCMILLFGPARQSLMSQQIKESSGTVRLFPPPIHAPGPDNGNAAADFEWVYCPRFAGLNLSTVINETMSPDKRMRPGLTSRQEPCKASDARRYTI